VETELQTDQTNYSQGKSKYLGLWREAFRLMLAPSRRPDFTICLMNRTQFFVLTGLCSLVFLLLAGHIWLEWQVARDQAVLTEAQRQITQAQTFQAPLKQLAVRIFNDSQKSQDQALKDLLTRNDIKYTPPPAGAAAGQTPAATGPATTH
jgi:hypothetical protein